tara:strand:+ start:731 stop:910 length:180 start_codon:yes stop_codon:yes gene_type:complete
MAKVKLKKKKDVTDVVKRTFQAKEHDTEGTSIGEWRARQRRIQAERETRKILGVKKKKK